MHNLAWLPAQALQWGRDPRPALSDVTTRLLKDHNRDCSGEREKRQGFKEIPERWLEKMSPHHQSLMGKPSSKYYHRHWGAGSG